MLEGVRRKGRALTFSDMGFFTSVSTSLFRMSGNSRAF